MRQDASWIEAVTHVPVSTIAADRSNPASSGPELKPAFVKCVKAIREQSFTEMREADEGRRNKVVIVPSFVT